MKYIYLDILHSYQYTNKSKIKLNQETLSITDNLGNKLIGLTNIPNDNSLYKIILKKINKINYLKEKINLKVNLRIDFKKLTNIITNGLQIPNRIQLFSILRRNLFNISLINNQLDDDIFKDKSFDKSNITKMQNNLLSWIKKNEKKNHIYNFLNQNVIKLHNLYADTLLERFYLNNKNVNNNITIPGSTIIASPIINIRNIFLNLINEEMIKLKKNYNYNNTIENNNITLIISSSANVDKWKYLLNKQKNIKFLNISNKSSIEKYTYQDILNNNVVILSHKIFSNVGYTNLWGDYMSNKQSLKEAFNTIKLEILRNKEIMSSKRVIYQLINWNRIILDDNLEFTDKNNIDKRMFDLFKYRYIWVVNENETNNKLDFINKSFEIITKNKINKLNKNLVSLLSNNIRYINFNNFKNNISMKNEFISFNNFEKKYYSLVKNNNITNEINQFCSLSSNKITIKYKNISDIETKFHPYNNTKCIICLDNIDQKNMGITKCHHTYCFSCLYNWVSTNNSCPTCRNKLTNHEIYKINFNSNYDNDYIIRHCSKLEYLLNKISKIKEKTIIISNFISSLDIIASTLKNTNNEFIFINNSTTQNNKNIEIFNKKDIDIILIPYSNLTTLNKINSNNIIFLEPLKNENHTNNKLNLILSKTNLYSLKCTSLIINESVESESLAINI